MTRSQTASNKKPRSSQAKAKPQAMKAAQVTTNLSPQLTEQFRSLRLPSFRDHFHEAVDRAAAWICDASDKNIAEAKKRTEAFANVTESWTFAQVGAEDGGDRFGAQARRRCAKGRRIAGGALQRGVARIRRHGREAATCRCA